MTPKKIAIISTCLDRGGAENALLNLLKTVERERYAPTVFSLRPIGSLGDEIKALGIETASANLIGRMNLMGGIKSIKRWLSVTRPDLIQGWMYHGNLSGSIGSRRHPVIWSIHSFPNAAALCATTTKLAVTLSRKISHSHSRAIIYCSRHALDLHTRLGFQSEIVEFIPNGIDTKRFTNSPSLKSDARRQFGIHPQNLAVGMAARYHPVKGHADFVRAAAQIAQSRANVQFLLCGRGVTPENDPLKAAIQKTGMAERFRLVGEQADMCAFYAALDILASSSVSEAFPLSLCEASCMGVPCVATDAGDSAEIIGNPDLIVPCSDPTRLAEKIVWLLDLDSESRSQLGQNARTRVEEQFSVLRMAAGYADVWERVLFAARRAA